ncbi:ribonuclease domain-containing protein [Antrihabitans cavernicola]|uniref:Ribonuclease n=1 Tax=Antrihabitans cavernicola TaxID=2495913 RepID=A0A5A7SC23_9NOCA|nr:ribonuclease domain-containing protein [Spelaeibacter cavernicola]KAA0022702.1 ribonuclease [Spelaeibacter cavernicola]
MRGRKSLGAYAALALLVVVLAVAGFLSLHGGSSGSGGSTSIAKSGSVPAAATATLSKIDDGSWPESANAPGTNGGTTWQNREHNLPAKDSAGKAVKYQEWDVNPKKRGQSRDAQRIITGSDGSAWYTGDHYKTFTRMR